LDREEILLQIRKLMEEKKDVSKEYDIKFYNGSNEVRRICKTCNLPIGYPTEQELKENGFI
jgi:hypothetical protein